MLLSSVIAFSQTPLFFPTIERVAAIESSCPSLAINSLAASGDDGNVPSNAIDDNLGTRWSDYGIGPWLIGDLGSKMLLMHQQYATSILHGIMETKDQTTLKYLFQMTPLPIRLYIRK